MKTLYILCAFVSLNILPSQGQSFSNVALRNSQFNKVLSFTLSKEVNTRYYRVEASDDSITFDIIGTIPTTGSSMLAKTYNYALAGNSHKYYRVGIVGMNASLQYSRVISEHNADAPIIKRIPVGNDGTITKNGNQDYPALNTVGK